MPRLDYQTAGESHGPAVLCTVTGLPAGLTLDVDFINSELARRQGGYGRGGRQRIETDRVEFLSGVRQGHTIGSPLTMIVRNKDSRLDDPQRTPPVHRPRPGHADLAGSVKWLTTDCRETLERASARETAARVAAGAVARCLLREYGVEAFGFVRAILDAETAVQVAPQNWRSLVAARDASETYCPDPAATERQCEIIRQAKIDKDTVGGVVETHVFGCPPGLGSCMDWRDKLDARVACAVMGIQAFKAVEIGLGRECARRTGSQVHDPIHFDAAKVGTNTLGFERPTNNAGGTEGGMTNGQPVVVRGTMKPISTLLRGLPSVNLNTKQPEQSQYERSDICAVSAASVVMENVVAFEIARALLDKFPADSMTELDAAFRNYMNLARSLPLDPPAMTIA
ncbi:MAG: chorismate synthase [Leptolyngbya sp. PLA2]|nr:chorismate synthase [Leptolyngbya sp.]MCE7971345.1 chorismate synthase [Leptolyngbya sp. PL-A2]MCQ3940562.1 chorismate synthase [cyanobacterium CYA1]MCZ7632442.1 chorismate synthase [Phycisphaerales bacterium]MDL1903532.1 chorismate synthase [Synechococcales cyanobacterium CNB]GIK20003.1 MAG: chorismate synthase [Planctomycetota bacterium]